MNLMSDVLEQQEGFIKQIMEVSKNEKTGTNFTEVNFKSLVEKALLYHAHMPQADAIEFKTEISAENLKTDSLRIEIILNNLLSNAIKYSDPKKEFPFIKISSYSRNENFIFEIQDNGIGIDANHVTKIFDVFYVANESQNGSGVGLYLTRETARKIGGEILVESTLAEGSIFTVTLPQG
jgi:signal transduction histidine kinase